MIISFECHILKRRKIVYFSFRPFIEWCENTFESVGMKLPERNIAHFALHFKSIDSFAAVCLPGWSMFTFDGQCQPTKPNLRKHEGNDDTYGQYQFTLLCMQYQVPHESRHFARWSTAFTLARHRFHLNTDLASSTTLSLLFPFSFLLFPSLLFPSLSLLPSHLHDKRKAFALATKTVNVTSAFVDPNQRLLLTQKSFWPLSFPMVELTVWLLLSLADVFFLT